MSWVRCPWCGQEFDVPCLGTTEARLYSPECRHGVQIQAITDQGRAAREEGIPSWGEPDDPIPEPHPGGMNLA